MAEDTHGVTENQPWCPAIQVGEGRWLEIKAVVSFVDGHCHKIEFPGFMTRTGESFGLTATFHTVDKAWQDGDIDRGNISRMVMVDGFLMTLETVAKGVELVRQKTAIKGKGKMGMGLPSWLENGQALVVFGAKPPLGRPEKDVAVGEDVDPLAGVPEADLSSEYLAQDDASEDESKKKPVSKGFPTWLEAGQTLIASGPSPGKSSEKDLTEAALERTPETPVGPPPVTKDLADQKAAEDSPLTAPMQSPEENTEKSSTPAKKNRVTQSTTPRTINFLGIEMPEPKKETGKEAVEQGEPEQAALDGQKDQPKADAGHNDGKSLLSMLIENLRSNNEDPTWYDEKEARRNEHARPIAMDTPIPVPPPLNSDGSE